MPQKRPQNFQPCHSNAPMHLSYYPTDIEFLTGEGVSWLHGNTRANAPHQPSPSP